MHLLNATRSAVWIRPFVCLALLAAGCDAGPAGGGPVCGDGMLEAPEECERSDLGGATCATVGDFDGGTLACTSDCEYDDSGCTTAPLPVCGDDVAEGSEVCDGDDLDGATCANQGGFDGGTLACNGTCDGFDTSGCIETPVCGDSVVEGNEVCDTDELDGHTCVSEGFDDGLLACNGACNGFDTSNCFDNPACGDDVAEGGETCDGTDLAGETCATQGFAGGTLACAVGCAAFDTSGCTAGPSCGDGTANGAEVCDGTDLRAATCVSQGFAGGTLACAAGCAAYNTSGCTAGPSCGDGTANGAEVCDGADLRGATCASQGFAGGTLACAAVCAAYNTSGCTAPAAGEACTTAYDVSGGPFPVVLPGTFDDDPAAGFSCDSTPTNVVWFAFTPAADGVYDLAAYNNTLTFAFSGLAVLDGLGCAPYGPELACATDSSTGVATSVSLRAAYPYLIAFFTDGDAYTMESPELTVTACGNGVSEVGEACDGGDLGGQSCQSLGYTGGALACRADCSDYDRSACTGGVCGDGFRTNGEVCDGGDLAGATCAALGYDAGPLGCAPACDAFDDTGCYNFVPGDVCGAPLAVGVTAGPVTFPGTFDEDPALGFSCDDTPTNTVWFELSAPIDGFYTISASNFSITDPYSRLVVLDGLACNPYAAELACVVNNDVFATVGATLTGGATYLIAFFTDGDVYTMVDPTLTVTPCGDGVAEGPEACDGGDTAGITCVDLGYTGGTLGCQADCSGFDVTTCAGSVCGDGIIGGGEVCDGTNVGAESCLTRGYTAGVLGCAPTCDALDEAACFNATPGQACGVPYALPGGGGAVTITGTFDDDPVDGFSCDAFPTNSVWAELTAASSGTYDFSAFNNTSTFAFSRLVVLDGPACSPYGAELACVTNADATASASADLLAGNTYLIAFFTDGDAYTMVDPVLTYNSCGNDLIEGLEACDGSDLSGATCVGLGYSGGTLGCETDCSAYDVSACTGGACGDGVVNGSEVCDDLDLVGETCVSRGYDAGVLACAPSCAAFDESGCYFFGPGSACALPFDLTGVTGTVQATGQFDDDPVAGFSCDGSPTNVVWFELTAASDGDYAIFASNTSTSGPWSRLVVLDGLACGPYGAELSCVTNTDVFASTTVTLVGGNTYLIAFFTDGNSYTMVDPQISAGSAVAVCGDGVIGGSEPCDGFDVGSATCQARGYDAGVLGCAPTCDAFDDSGCYDYGPGDFCSLPVDLTGLPVPVQLTHTFDDDPVTGFTCDTTPTNVAWYQYTASSTGTHDLYAVNHSPTGPYSRLVVLDGLSCGPYGAELACATNTAANVVASANLTAGNTYVIAFFTDGDTYTMVDPEISVSPALAVSTCWVDAPADQTLEEGQLHAVYGRLYVPGLTDRTTGPDGWPSLIAEVGVAANGTNPTISPVTFVWNPAFPNPTFVDASVDEFVADIVAPRAAASPYDVVYRFSVDAGATWTYCDTVDSTFDVAQAANLTTLPTTVTAVPGAVGDVIITEITQNPNVLSDSVGEWFEVYNPTAGDWNLQGCVIRDLGLDSHTINGPFIVPAGRFVAAATDARPGFTPGYVYATFILGNADDEVLIDCGGLTIDSVAYTGALPWPDPAGASMALSSGSYDATVNDDPLVWCEETLETYNGDFGSPNRPNPGCP